MEAIRLPWIGIPGEISNLRHGHEKRARRIARRCAAANSEEGQAAFLSSGLRRSTAASRKLYHILFS